VNATGQAGTKAGSELTMFSRMGAGNMPSSGVDGKVEKGKQKRAACVPSYNFNNIHDKREISKSRSSSSLKD
jgi:hypothetical protein